MAINLSKGERVTLSSGLNNIIVGLGWDPNEGTGHEYDLDASAFCLGDNGNCPEEKYFVFYDNEWSPDKAVQGPKDDLTGGNSDGGDDEEIKITLNKLSSSIKEIVIYATIYDPINRKQNFGQVRNSYMRIIDRDNNDEIMKYELDEDFSTETAVEFGRLYRRGDEWKFEAIGKGYNEELGYFVTKYGLSVK